MPHPGPGVAGRGRGYVAAEGGDPVDPRGALRLTIDAPVVGVRVVHVAGALGREGVARLNRSIDAQVHLAGTGRCPIAYLVLDLDGVTDYDPDAVGALREAAHVCARAGIGLLLAGFLPLAARLPIRVRHHLGGVRAFPTVEAAVRSVGGGPRRPR